MHHIGELRKRLWVILVVLAIGTAIAYPFSERYIIPFILAPVKDILGKGYTNLVVLGILDAMLVRFGVSLWAAGLVTSPVTIWQAMMFFLPALRERERKWFTPTFAAMVVLFITGVVFCYALILHSSFIWLADQAGSIAKLQLQLGPLLEVVQFFLLGFGVAFQVPVVVFYLVYFNVLSYAKLRKNWRTVWIIILVVAAGITPDWAPITMGGLGGAMLILYEGSMAVVRIALSRKIKERAALVAAEEAAEGK